MKKNIIVTGGASGIGLAATELLSKEGFNVIVLDINNTQDLKKLPVSFIECDLSNPFEIENTFKTISEENQNLHGLINAAGVLSYGDVEQLAVDDWDKVMNINVRAPFLCAKYSIPLMGNNSIIINIASVQSFYAQPKVAAYATSKAALLGLTRTIAIDFAGHVRCISVCPGTIDTPMLHNALQQSKFPDKMMDELKKSHLTKRVGEAKEVAELLVFLCSDRCQFITGTEIRIDGGLGINLGGSIE